MDIKEPKSKPSHQKRKACKESNNKNNQFLDLIDFLDRQFNKRKKQATQSIHDVYKCTTKQRTRKEKTKNTPSP